MVTMKNQTMESHVMNSIYDLKESLNTNKASTYYTKIIIIIIVAIIIIIIIYYYNFFLIIIHMDNLYSITI